MALADEITVNLHKMLIGLGALSFAYVILCMMVLNNLIKFSSRSLLQLASCCIWCFIQRETKAS